MNKLRIATLIAVFTTFTVLGFTAAKYFGHYIFVRPVEAAEQPAPPPPGQQNVLLIRVNNLQDPHPDLISVWVVFIAQYDSPYVSMKALYPDPLNGYAPTPVRAIFSLDEQGGLSERFKKWLREDQVEWDGYFLVDQAGMTRIGEWATGEKPQIMSLVPKNSAQYKAVFLEEAALFEDLCSQINTDTAKDHPALSWSDLTPEHLQTDITFDAVMGKWDQIHASGMPAHCEVIGLN